MKLFTQMSVWCLFSASFSFLLCFTSLSPSSSSVMLFWRLRAADSFQNPSLTLITSVCQMWEYHHTEQGFAVLGEIRQYYTNHTHHPFKIHHRTTYIQSEVFSFFLHFLTIKPILHLTDIVETLASGHWVSRSVFRSHLYGRQKKNIIIKLKPPSLTVNRDNAFIHVIFTCIRLASTHL